MYIPSGVLVGEEGGSTKHLAWKPKEVKAIQLEEF
jgi:hypothetical protein